jgi:hypothetical protein
MNNRQRAISVRKLAALDIIFHGPRLILIEFLVAVVFNALLGLGRIYSGMMRAPTLDPIVLVLG